MTEAVDLVFDACGNKKQVEAARYWADDFTFDIAYGGSKGCNAYYNQVKTKRGCIQIKDVEVSDYVLTRNEKSKKSEWKKVLDVKKYLNPTLSDYHKIITFEMRDGNIISLTTNHELYIGGSWISIGELAKRILEGDRWRGGEVFHLDTRENNVSMEKWTDERLFFEWHHDEEGLQKSILGDKISQRETLDVLSDSPVSCYVFRPKSNNEAHCESYRFQQNEQSLVESGMGERQGKRSSLERSVPSAICFKERSEKQYDFIDRRSSHRNSQAIQEKNCNKRNVRKRIRRISSDNKRHHITQELDPYLIKEIRFELLQGCVYDLHVEDNHNYCLTDKNFIVHNSGKSFLGCSLILADALIYDGTHYFIARKTLADLRKYTSTSIAEVLQGWDIDKKSWRYNGMDNYYTFENESKVYFLDCKPMPSDPLYYRFGSIQMTRGMIEEAGEVDEAAKNALVATIGRWKNDVYNLAPKLLLTCNPSKNFLYQDYYEPHKNGLLGKNSKRKFIQALPTDNQKLPPGYLEMLEANLSYAERRRLLHGDWEYDEDPSVLMDYDSILDVFRDKPLPDGKKCMTVDIARMGGARVVAIVWNGYKGRVFSWSRAELPKSLEKIEDLRMKFNIGKKDVLVDGDGIGPGIGDYGGYHQFRNNFPAAVSLIAKLRRDRNGNKVKENFDNRKSQCGFQIADIINERGMYLRCERDEDRQLIIQELEQVRKKHLESDLKNALEPKEKMSKMLRRSPDFWDAILMRRWVDYIKKTGLGITARDGNENIKGQYGERRRYNRYGA